MTTRTPAAAIKWANAQKTGYSGLCLGFAHDAYDIPAKYGDAITAWTNAEHKHVTTDLASATTGAFLFMQGKDPHGHVCIYLGGGKVRTTDSSAGHPMTYTLDQMKSFGYKFLGWSEDVNGVRVAGLAPKVVTKPAPKPTNTSASGDVDVRDLQRRLNLIFPAYSRLAVDGLYGPKTEAVVKEFQKRSGLTATGKIDAATKAALKKAGVL